MLVIALAMPHCHSDSAMFEQSDARSHADGGDLPVLSSAPSEQETEPPVVDAGPTPGDASEAPVPGSDSDEISDAGDVVVSAPRDASLPNGELASDAALSDEQSSTAPDAGDAGANNVGGFGGGATQNDAGDAYAGFDAGEGDQPDEPTFDDIHRVVRALPQRESARRWQSARPRRYRRGLRRDTNPRRWTLCLLGFAPRNAALVGADRTS